MNSWYGKTILITGATSGIGLALVKQALENGAKVSALFRSKNKYLEELQSDALLITQGDIRQRKDIANWIDKTRECFGSADILLNNAGTMYYMHITKPDYNQMKNMIETNCLGFVHLIQEALPLLMISKQGHWINITSDAGKQPFPGLAVYSGSKAFIEFTAKAMRQELLEKNIKITNIQPGNVDTPLHAKSTEKSAVKQYGSVNSGQYLSTNDIVQAVAFALSTPHETAVNEILIQPLTESF